MYYIFTLYLQCILKNHPALIIYVISPSNYYILNCITILYFIHLLLNDTIYPTNSYSTDYIFTHLLQYTLYIHITIILYTVYPPCSYNVPDIHPLIIYYISSTCYIFSHILQFILCLHLSLIVHTIYSPPHIGYTVFLSTSYNMLCIPLHLQFILPFSTSFYSVYCLYTNLLQLIQYIHYFLTEYTVYSHISLSIYYIFIYLLEYVFMQRNYERCNVYKNLISPGQRLIYKR